MCFSENMSLIIGLSGLASGVYFSQKNSYAAIGIAYFSLMEIIQYFQYKVIDQCNNKWNKFFNTIRIFTYMFSTILF